jgi:hypothetical protein
MEKYYWFSFSHAGGNQGVCLVEADTPEEARHKVIELNIAPDHDHVQCYGISKPEIPLNVLITPKEMVELGYTSVKTTL